MWASDGRIYFVTDRWGRPNLASMKPDGTDVKRLTTFEDYDVRWPAMGDGRIVYQHKMDLWSYDLASGRNVKVDTDPYDTPWRTMNPAWSHDSRWLTYARQVRNHLRAVFVYSLERRKATQITDGLSDARFPVFDRDGQHLFFTASTNAGPSAGWIDMSKFDHPVTRNVYVVVLRADRPSPLAPQSDE